MGLAIVPEGGNDQYRRVGMFCGMRKEAFQDVAPCEITLV